MKKLIQLDLSPPSPEKKKKTEQKKKQPVRFEP